MTIIEGHWSRPCDPCRIISKGAVLFNQDRSKAVAIETWGTHTEVLGGRGSLSFVTGSAFVDGDPLDFRCDEGVYRCILDKPIRASTFHKNFECAEASILLIRPGGAFLLDVKEMERTDAAIEENFVEIKKQFEALKQSISDLRLRLAVRIK